MRKTQSIEVVPLQRVAPETVEKFTYDVADLNFVSIFFHLGKVDSSGANAAPAIIRIEGDPGNGFYYPLTSFSFEITAPAASVVTGSNPAGATFLTVSSVPASFKKGDYLFVRNISSGDVEYVTGLEWARIKSSGSTSITFDTALTYDHNVTGGFTSTVYSGAEFWPATLNVRAVSNLRILIDASRCSKPIYIEATAVELDSP